jgi:hypothetical protein
MSSASRIEKVAFVPNFAGQTQARRLPFEDLTGAVRCWSIGRQSAEEFCARGIEASFPVFRTESGRSTWIKVHFPIRDAFFLATRVRIQGAPTLVNVLRAVEDFARRAVEIGYTTPPGWKPSPSSSQPSTHTSYAEEVLRGLQCCYLVVSRGGGHKKVYVRLTPGEA